MENLTSNLSHIVIALAVIGAVAAEAGAPSQPNAGPAVMEVWSA